MREPVQMMDVLTRLRLKGFMLSIDDFGTGYSSLVQLQRLPFSEIKIDASFVSQMTTNTGSRVIVEIIIDLAHKLSLKSAAEGVEDAAALRVLDAMGCDFAQGYYLSRPVAAERIPAIVAQVGAPENSLPNCIWLTGSGWPYQAGEARPVKNSTSNVARTPPCGSAKRSA